ncbi:MAG: glycoside hydrolase family 38 C-terminal domain-containing protein [Caldicoprobacterales bacterium]
MLSQIVRGPQTDGTNKQNTLFEASIPAMGYRVYWAYLDKECHGHTDGNFFKTSNKSIENEYIKLEIEEYTGCIKSLYDKKNKAEAVKGAAAVPIVIDIRHCDTWAHGIFRFDEEIGRFTDARVELKEEGPVRSLIRVTSSYNQSVLRQDFIVYRNKPEVHVKVKA